MGRWLAIHPPIDLVACFSFVDFHPSPCNFAPVAEGNGDIGLRGRLHGRQVRGTVRGTVEERRPHDSAPDAKGPLKSEQRG